MIIEERDAKKLVCPWARNIKPEGKCLGSECMSWRSFWEPSAKHNADVEFRRSGKRPDKPTTGFCKLIEGEAA